MAADKDLFLIRDDMSPRELLEVANRYRCILEDSNDGIISFDRDYIVRYANAAAGDFLGIPSYLMIGKSIHDYLGDEQFEILKELCASSYRNDSKICSTITPESIPGEVRSLELCIAADSKCGSGLSSIYLSDRTELNSALLELRNRNAFFNNLIDSSADGIIASDMEGKIILFNKGAQQMIGYSENEAKAKLHVSQLYPHGEAQKIMMMLRSEKYGGVGRLLRHRLTGVTKKGKTIPLSLSGAIIYGDEGVEMATVGIFTDMRQIDRMGQELKTKEAELIKSEKLASLGKLAAGVAHEINNPLTGILTFAEDLIEESDKTDERLGDYKIIHQEALRCREIVRDLLDFAKQDDKLSARPMNINQVVLQTFSLVRRLASFQNIEITHKLWPEPLYVVGDPTQLQQVFLNMMVNASEAMPDGGELYIATKLSDDSKQIVASFSDTGPGIPPETLANIFEPFFSTKGGKSNGLGLAVSWGIVENHGGQITVDTAQGQGTSFHVRLPSAFPDTPPKQRDYTAEGPPA